MRGSALSAPTAAMVWLCVGGLSAASGQATAESIPRLVAQLKGSDAAKATEALHKLLAAGGQGEAAARDAVKELLQQHGRKWDDAHRRLLARPGPMGDPARISALVKSHARLAKAAAEVLKFAFDHGKYPVPTAPGGGWRPGKYYQKGQVLLEGRVEVAIGIFNQVECELVGAFGVKLAPKPPGGGGFAKDYLRGELREPQTACPILTYNLVDCVPAWSQIGGFYAGWYRALRQAEAAYDRAAAMAVEAGIDAAAKSSKLPGLVLATAAVFSGDAELALKHRPADGDERKLFDILVRRYVLVRNARQRGKWSPADKAPLRQLNLYRLALCLDPLAANDKLHTAALEHSQWMHRNRQAGHGRPERNLRTPTHRCWAQGYRAAIVENVSAGSRNPIWSWRADASHHRNLLFGTLRAAGVGRAGRFCTYNAGTLLEDKDLARLLGVSGSPAMRW